MKAISKEKALVRWKTPTGPPGTGPTVMRNSMVEKGERSSGSCAVERGRTEEAEVKEMRKGLIWVACSAPQDHGGDRAWARLGPWSCCSWGPWLCPWLVLPCKPRVLKSKDPAEPALPFTGRSGSAPRLRWVV